MLSGFLAFRLLVSPSGMVETPRLQTKSRLRSVRGANTSSVCGTEALHDRHARAGGHPGCSARELDSRFRGNDGRGWLQSASSRQRLNPSACSRG